MYRSESVWTTFDIATKVPCTSRSIQFWPPKFSSKSSICGQCTKIISKFLIFIFSVPLFVVFYICLLLLNLFYFVYITVISSTSMSLEFVCMYVEAVECSTASDPAVLYPFESRAILTSKTIMSWRNAFFF